jgi:hypothetical protein
MCKMGRSSGFCMKDFASRKIAGGVNIDSCMMGKAIEHNSGCACYCPEHLHLLCIQV